MSLLSRSNRRALLDIKSQEWEASRKWPTFRTGTELRKRGADAFRRSTAMANSDIWTPEQLATYRAMQAGAKVSNRPARKDYKAQFEQQLRLVGIQVETEFIFAAPRKYRADYRVQGTNILIEFEGGLFAKGKQGHSSVAGILRDMEKANVAQLGGWIQIRIAPNHVVSGQALKWVEEAIGAAK